VHCERISFDIKNTRLTVDRKAGTKCDLFYFCSRISYDIKIGLDSVYEDTVIFEVRMNFFCGISSLKKKQIGVQFNESPASYTMQSV